MKGSCFPLVSAGISIINFRFLLFALRPEKLLLTPSCFLQMFSFLPLIRFLVFVMPSLDLLPLVTIFQIPKLTGHVPGRYTATTANYSPPDVVHAELREEGGRIKRGPPEKECAANTGGRKAAGRMRSSVSSIHGCA